MTVVCPLHWYYRETHLKRVTGQMTVLGPPVLRGHLDGLSGAVLLREGTHRIRAALALGLEPSILLIPWWRSRMSLERARFAAMERGLSFPSVRFLEAR